MNSTGSDKRIDMLSLALDGLAAKPRAIGNNIANADPPGYERQNVPFAETGP